MDEIQPHSLYQLLFVKLILFSEWVSRLQWSLWHPVGETAWENLTRNRLVSTACRRIDGKASKQRCDDRGDKTAERFSLGGETEFLSFGNSLPETWLGTI